MLIGMPKDEAEKVKALLDDAVHRAVSAGAPSSATSGAEAPVKDVPSQLRELAALRDEGILSAEEFEVQKAKLLA